MATHDAFRNPFSLDARAGFQRQHGFGPQRFDRAARRSRWGRFRGWVSRPIVRASARVFTIAVVVAAILELGLRTLEAVATTPLAALDPLSALKLAPGTQWNGRSVNRLGYRDDEFQPRLSSDGFRIAVLGNELTLSPTKDDGCLDRFERRMHGLEIYNFALRSAGPTEFVGQASVELPRYRPDLVLVFLTIGDEASPQADDVISQWRSVRAARYALRAICAPADPQTGIAALAAQTSYEQHLASAAQRLSVCRVQQSARAQKSWRRVQRCLDRVVSSCQASKSEVAIVMVPADFQVDATLRHVLVRRSGATATDFDFELPQRRLVRYAQDQGIGVLDLLPSLRASAKPVFGATTAYLNTDGMDVAADALAHWMDSRYGTTIASATRPKLTQHP
ncbi:MAG TPA: hypothetical protein VHV77_05175 [Pirellulales bacterium]|nr:hypothetical protein [Pirellulales bacterium]